jgi:hypothetical protein
MSVSIAEKIVFAHALLNLPGITDYFKRRCDEFIINNSHVINNSIIINNRVPYLDGNEISLPHNIQNKKIIFNQKYIPPGIEFR